MNRQTAEQALDLDSYTDLSVGEILRRTREYYGQSLPQVEVNLRIRASQLEAIENLDLERLPGRVYAIGFVRAYSEYLGLDGDKMVHLFKAQSVGKRVKPQLKFPVTFSESKTPNIHIILFSMVATILLIAYWTVFYTPTKYVERIPPVPESLKQGSIPLLKTTAEALEKESEEATVEEASVKMELVVSQDSWVEIKNPEGKVVVRQVLKPGDKYVVPEEEGYTISTGNAGGVTVFIGGKKVRTLGKSSEVKRNIALTAASFTEND